VCNQLHCLAIISCNYDPTRHKEGTLFTLLETGIIEKQIKVKFRGIYSDYEGFE